MRSINSLFSHTRLKQLYFDGYQSVDPFFGVHTLNDAEPDAWPRVMLSNVHNARANLQFQWRMIEISLTGQQALRPKDMTTELLLLDNGQCLLVIGLPEPAQPLDCYGLILLLPKHPEDAYEQRYWLLEAGRYDQEELQPYLCCWTKTSHRLISLDGPPLEELPELLCRQLGRRIVMRSHSSTPEPVTRLDSDNPRVAQLRQRIFGDR